jgi:hypothetical protein
MKRIDPDPTALLGRAVIVLAIGLLGLVIFVPAAQGASPGAKFYLAGFALMGLGWGIKQVRAAKRAKDRVKHAEERRTHGDS